MPRQEFSSQEINMAVHLMGKLALSCKMNIVGGSKSNNPPGSLLLAVKDNHNSIRRMSPSWLIGNDLLITAPDIIEEHQKYISLRDNKRDYLIND